MSSLKTIFTATLSGSVWSKSLIEKGHMLAIQEFRGEELIVTDYCPENEEIYRSNGQKHEVISCNDSTVRLLNSFKDCGGYPMSYTINNLLMAVYRKGLERGRLMNKNGLK